MRIYGVTESELRHLSTLNLFMTAVFSIGSALLGGALDLHKDLLLAAEIPAKAEILGPTQVFLFIGCGVFYLMGIVAWFQRRGYIDTIKSESVK